MNQGAQGDPGPTRDEWLSIRECADELKVSTWTLWKAASIGHLPVIRVGTRPGRGVFRIRREDWEAWKRSRRALAKPMWPANPNAVGDGSSLIDRVMAIQRQKR